MLNNIEQSLDQLGFSANEQKVYLAALKLGQAAVVNIAKIAGVERTATYRILQKLAEKNLVITIPAGKRMQWRAAHPKKLDDITRKQRQTVANLIPELIAIFAKKEELPKISYFEGNEELLKINQEMIEEAKHRSEVLSFSSPGAFFPAMNRKDWDRLVQKRIKKQILSRLLMPDLGGAPGYKEGEDWKNWRIVKLVDPARFPFKVTVNVAADKVSIMAVRRKIPIAIVINDREITETFRMIFEMAWQNQKK